MRLRNYLSAKIHNATVTNSDLHYVGSITIDKKLLELSGMKKNDVFLSLTIPLDLDWKHILLRVKETVVQLE